MSLDLISLGGKLKKCREQLLLDFIEVEKGTGINGTRLHNFEEGNLEPSGDEILILADFYKQDYLFLISNQKKSASDQIDILYRTFGTSFTKEDRWAIQKFLFLCECEQMLWDDLEYKPNQFTYQPQGNYFKGHGESAAKLLRQHLGYKPNEISRDIYYDLRSIGIHIFRMRLSNSEISGLFIQHPIAGKCILVNYEEDIFRQNFTLAHEVGHSIFDFGKQINISFFNDAKDMREIRANAFASNFLIAKEAFNSLVINNWSEEIIRKLAIQLKVNILPLLISLKENKLITQLTYNNYKQLKLTQKEKEDPELNISDGKVKAAKRHLLERGLSFFYVNKCFDAYNKKLVSESKFAEMLLCSEFELPQILEMFSLKLNYGN